MAPPLYVQMMRCAAPCCHVSDVNDDFASRKQRNGTQAQPATLRVPMTDRQNLRGMDRCMNDSDTSDSFHGQRQSFSYIPMRANERQWSDTCLGVENALGSHHWTECAPLCWLACERKAALPFLCAMCCLSFSSDMRKGRHWIRGVASRHV